LKPIDLGVIADFDRQAALIPHGSMTTHHATSRNSSAMAMTCLRRSCSRASPLVVAKVVGRAELEEAVDAFEHAIRFEDDRDLRKASRELVSTLRTFIDETFHD